MFTQELQVYTQAKRMLNLLAWHGEPMTRHSSQQILSHIKN